MTVAGRVDEVAPRPGGAPAWRSSARSWAAPWSARRSNALLGRVDPARRRPQADRRPKREALIETLAKTYGDRLAVQVLPDDVTELVSDAAQRLVELGVLRDRPDLLTPVADAAGARRPIAGDVLGFARPTLLHAGSPTHLDAEHDAPAQGADEVAQLGAVRPRRRRRELGGPRRADEAGRATGSCSRDEPTPEETCRPSRRAWTSRSPTGSCSGRRRRTTWSRR